MRIKHFFGLAVLAAMTASCSSNNDLVVGGGNGSGENESGVGYATLSINLPTTNGTRAAGDPEFKPGDANEYDVKDVTLLIFKEAGSSENEYTFVEKADLGTMAPWVKDDDNNGITTAATITAKLSFVDLNGKYYALAILNNKVNTTDLKVQMPTKDQTYSAWNSANNTDGTKFANNTNGFYMANAPEFTAAGTEPTTLVKIDKIYATKQAAETNKATTIHVERGLAKVTVAALPTNQTPTGSKYNNDKVDITAWNLDVTNKSTFPIHKTAGLTSPFTTIWSASTEAAPSTGRFVDGTNTAFKRVYWGIDPNYSTDYTTVADCEKEFTVLAANAEINGGAATPQYCLENTFDISHMMQGQTTRVVFKATYTPNGFKPGDTFYKIGNNTDLWKKADLEAQIKAKAQEVLKETNAANVTVTLNAAENNIEESAGTKILTEANVQHKSNNETNNVTKDQIKAINEKLGLKAATATDPIVGIATYASGVSYYIARIKHFGDDLTSWKEGNDTYGDNNEDNNKKYLGRYGVLRNNWYELTVHSVSGPGTPDVPTIKPTDPDDENYKYINVSVKILDWAKRSQSVDL
nr:Mfa1 family fimbria major subunit [Prevotella sp.]